MTKKTLKSLVPVLRELGIKRFKTAEFELEFWSTRAPEPADLSPPAPEKLHSDEEVLFWSAGDVGSGEQTEATLG